MRRLLHVLGGALAALAALALTLVAFSPAQLDVPDLEVRTVPWRTQAGRLPQAYPPGQGFVPEQEGLRRIDVALVVQGPTEGAALELVLRADGPTGEELRRVRLDADHLPPQGERGWASFEFEPVSSSTGLRLWWQLEAPSGPSWSPYTPWVRYLGQPGIDMAWGDRIVPGPVHEGDVADPTSAWGARDSFLRVPHPNLAALSFAVDVLRPAVGPCVLEVWGPGADPAVDPPLRRAELAPEEEVSGGYAFFAFEPIAESRWTEMRYRLTTNAGTRIVGTEHGPSFKTWHRAAGDDGADAGGRLLGASRGPLVHADRSLVFQSFGSPRSLAGWTRAAERAGWRLWAGGLAWTLAVATLALALGARRAEPSSTGARTTGEGAER